MSQCIDEVKIKQVKETNNFEPVIERVQALANISRLVLCCHSNETHAPIANPPNTAQQQSTPYHSSNLHLGPCSSMGMRRETDRHTDTQTHTHTHTHTHRERERETRVTNIHFASGMPHDKCNDIDIAEENGSSRDDAGWKCGKNRKQERKLLPTRQADTISLSLCTTGGNERNVRYGAKINIRQKKKRVCMGK